MPRFTAQLKDALPHLWRYAFSLTQDRAQADDLVQDCIERALRKKAMWDETQPLRPWLMKILLNLFRDRYRSRARLAEVPFVNDHAGATVDTKVEDRNELAAVVNRMQALPESQRQALELVAFGGLSYAEVSDVLSVPIGTVLSRVARARTKLNETANSQASGLRSVT